MVVWSKLVTRMVNSQKVTNEHVPVTRVPQFHGQHLVIRLDMERWLFPFFLRNV